MKKEHMYLAAGLVIGWLAMPTISTFVRTKLKLG